MIFSDLYNIILLNVKETNVRYIISIHYYKEDLPDDVLLKGDIAVDTEAMGLNNKRDRLCTVQLSNGDGSSHIIHFSGDDYSAKNLKKLLSNKNSVKIFHFGRFDIGILNYYLGMNIENVFCTKLASRLARTYTDQHGLKTLCNELLGVVLSKQKQCSDWGTQELDREQLEYSARDVLYLHELRDKLTKMLKREKRYSLAEKAFAFLIYRVELDAKGWEEDIFAY